MSKLQSDETVQLMSRSTHIKAEYLDNISSMSQAQARPLRPRPEPMTKLVNCSHGVYSYGPTRVHDETCQTNMCRSIDTTWQARLAEYHEQLQQAAAELSLIKESKVPR